MNSFDSPVIIFFGSSPDSGIVLNTLLSQHYSIACVVTQPPRPIGRDQILTKTPVQFIAESHNITVLNFQSSQEKPWLYHDDEQVIHTLQTFKPDLFITASYGQLIPWKSITSCSWGGINIHPSLLPRWRGADPTPWTILANDHQTGVTIVKLSQEFDEGTILAQKKVTVKPQLHELLRETLFTQGAKLLIETLPHYLSGNTTSIEQHNHHVTLARRITKQDGFIPWSLIISAIEQTTISWEQVKQLPITSHLIHQLGEETTKNLSTPLSSYLTRLYFALHPWPGTWTIVTMNGKEKRMKILDIQLTHEQFTLNTIQLEGKNPTSFSSIAAYISKVE
jgi:methionyl-tRNA formyltransferase